MALDLLRVLGYLRYLLQAYLWCDKASLLAKSSLILCQAWEGEGRVDRSDYRAFFGLWAFRHRTVGGCTCACRPPFALQEIFF